MYNGFPYVFIIQGGIMKKNSKMFIIFGLFLLIVFGIFFLIAYKQGIKTRENQVNKKNMFYKEQNILYKHWTIEKNKLSENEKVELVEKN